MGKGGEVKQVGTKSQLQPNFISYATTLTLDAIVCFVDQSWTGEDCIFWDSVSDTAGRSGDVRAFYMIMHDLYWVI